MKLLNCYIDNFGKLHNYKHNFQDGLNIINEHNGFGKTTFATFIKSMFYGLDTGTNTRVEKSERKRYNPWQGGNYGGNIEFEINNKKYRIERFFGKKASEDSFKLYDLSTNLESNDYTENIGEEIFKINKSAYERSTYIPQGQIQIEMEDSLSAKLGNVLESENDINTSDQAIEKLSETKKIYIKDRGKSGLIDEKKTKLNQMQRTLENSKTDIETLKIKQNKLSELNKKIVQQENEREIYQKELSEKLEYDRKVAKLETYKTILNKYNQYNKNIEILNVFFKNQIPEDYTLKNLIIKNTELENTKSEISNNKLSNSDIDLLESLKERFDGKNISEDDIDNNIKNNYKLPEIEKEIVLAQTEKDTVQKKVKTNKKIFILFFILGFLFLISGIVTKIAQLNNFIAILGIILGTTFCAIGAFLIYNKKDKILVDLNKKLQELIKNKQEIEKEVSQILKLSNTLNPDKSIALINLKSDWNTYNDLVSKQAEIDMNLNRYLSKKSLLENEIKHELSKYFEIVKNNYIELIQELNIKKNEYNIAMQQFEEYQKEKQSFEKENDINELQNIKDFSNKSEEILKEKINTANLQLDKLNDEKNQIKNQIELLENQLDETEYLETDIVNLNEEIETLNEKYKIISKTEDLLKTAKEQFSSSYLQDMLKGFKNYVSIINDEELNTSVDINLGVKVNVNGSQKEIKYFSAGYKDLIYICIRFSLIKALFKDEMPFVVLDDPFTNLDEDKTLKALDVIKEISKEYQIIYFVCNSSRAGNK